MNAIATHFDQQVADEERSFELAQRKAKVYSQSTLVPKEYQGNVGNVLIAQNMAMRMNADTLMVMQNLYIVHGKPGWSAQFLIACFNSCGRFSAIKYKFLGERGKPSYGCTAYSTELSTGEVIEGPTVTLEMATAEAWATKAGSKWKTMPELMLRYRAAAFLIRCTAPEIGMGLMTREELLDAGTHEPASNGTALVLNAIARKAVPSLQEPHDYSEELEHATTWGSLLGLQERISLDDDLPTEEKEILLKEIEARIEIINAEDKRGT